MPCNSDYMEASGKEIALSRVRCLLDELNGAPEINRQHWNGYHPMVYNKPQVDGDALVAELCARLQGVDVTRYSLEMQMWWRDHQRADKARLEVEMRDAAHRKELESALAKLTPYEQQLLGVKPRS